VLDQALQTKTFSPNNAAVIVNEDLENVREHSQRGMMMGVREDTTESWRRFKISRGE
jgi:hypothetical protein